MAFCNYAMDLLIDRIDDEVDDAIGREHDEHADDAPEHMPLAICRYLPFLLREKELDDAIEEVREREREDEADRRIEDHFVDLGEQRVDIVRRRRAIDQTEIHKRAIGSKGAG